MSESAVLLTKLVRMIASDNEHERMVAAGKFREAVLRQKLSVGDLGVTIEGGGPRAAAEPWGFCSRRF